MEKETSNNSISAWLRKQLLISVDRRRSYERRIAQRRSGFDRRMVLVAVPVDRRSGNERRAYK